MFTFDIRYLKACSLCASTETTRYYLNGVALQFDGATLVSVSTDGHRLVAFKIDYMADKGVNPFSIIIPKSVIDSIKLVKGVFTCTLENESFKYCLKYNDLKIYFTPIDGIFPAWQRVSPNETSGKVSQFNPKYLLDFEKIVNLWAKSGQIHVSHNGDGPALINFSGLEVEGYGVLMPRRGMDNPETKAPSWGTGFKTPSSVDIAA